MPGAPRYHQAPRFEVRELGEIDMASMPLATLDLLTHDGARPVFPAVHLEGHAVVPCGELVGLASGSGRVLRHSGKALVVCAGDRDLRALHVAGQPGRRAGLAAIAVHRAGRRLRPAMALPATAVQPRHECGSDGQLVGALRELTG